VVSSNYEGNGTMYTGEARGTPGEVQESSPEVCGRVRGSMAEHKRAWQSVRVRRRVQASVAAQERMGKHKSMESTWKLQNEQFQGLARHWLCHHDQIHSFWGMHHAQFTLVLPLCPLCLTHALPRHPSTSVHSTKLWLAMPQLHKHLMS
jgi:hypothetical protein